MTFNDLLARYQKQYGNNHDIIFFDIVFFLSKVVKTKNSFIVNRNINIDFKYNKYLKIMDDYWNKEKPLGHITGHTKFLGLDFKISKKVLVPRDATEQMVDDFICVHKDINKKHNVIDLCCGSGCIGISIKKYLPNFDVTCVDKYWGPILNTAENAINQQTKLTIDAKDAIKYLNSQKEIDILISNPPYINKENFNNTKMYKWESKKALTAKENGMYFYKRYFAYLSSHKFNECWLEVGYDLYDEIEKELSEYSNLKTNIKKDKQYIIVYQK